MVKPYEIGVSPLGPSRSVKAAIRKAVRDINHRSRDAQMRFERLLFSQYGIGPGNILLGNSLEELAYAVAQARQPRKALIIGPAIELYRNAAVSAEADVECLLGNEENGYLPDLSTVEDRRGNAEVVFISNPNRITGRAVDEVYLSRICESFSDKQHIVVVDETLIEFTRERSFLERVPAANHIIVLRTTACYYGLAGLELAFAASSGAVMSAVRERIHGQPNLPALAAARAAMKDKAFRRLTDTFMEREKKLLQRAAERLKEVDMYGSDANVILFQGGACLHEVARTAEKAGLAVEMIAGPGGTDRPLLRVSVMRHEHNLKLVRIMKQLCGEENGS